MEYFNSILEEYKVIKPNGISDYITKHDFDSVEELVFGVDL